MYPPSFDFGTMPHPFDRAGETSGYGEHEPWDHCYACGRDEDDPLHARPGKRGAGEPA